MVDKRESVDLPDHFRGNILHRVVHICIFFTSGKFRSRHCRSCILILCMDMKNIWTSILTTVCTAVSSVGLVSAVLWLGWGWVQVTPSEDNTADTGEDDVSVTIAGARNDIPPGSIRGTSPGLHWMSIYRIQRFIVRYIVGIRTNRVGHSLLQLNSATAMPSTVPAVSAHDLLVRHMQFSPDDKLLATCR